MPRLTRRTERILLLLIVLLAGTLRFYALDASSLWSDEGNTWALISRSVSQIARNAAADIHPPGYYWVLKGWTLIFGDSAWGMRSLSALVGALLVAVVYAIGCQAEAAEPKRLHLLGLLAATVAALNPFLIFYSQEARMYMLLTLLGALLFWALLALMSTDRADSAESSLLGGWFPGMIFVFGGTAGLWVHYSFPLLLAAAAFAYFVYWLRSWRALLSDASSGHLLRRLAYFAALNLLIVLFYLPWLSTAINSILNWPKGGTGIALGEGVRLTVHTLLFGPLRNVASPNRLWYLAGGLLPILGSFVLVSQGVRKRKSLLMDNTIALTAWLAAPIVVMFGLGLFSDAFLKFLLVAAPAWTLLFASVAFLSNAKVVRTLVGISVLLTSIVTAWSALPGYYTDPTARDNYAGIATYLGFEQRPNALALLNAPGQQDVWGYYALNAPGGQDSWGHFAPDVPFLALPQSRPPDAAATIATLQEAVADLDTVYALFWATDEADPDAIVEGWLDRNAFKGLESWQGNLRFATYDFARQMSCAPTPEKRFVDPTSATEILLVEACQPELPQVAKPGESVLVGLRWQMPKPIERRYKVTVQMLDERSQVVAQRDSEPVGGSMPTNTWQPNERITDNHALAILPGTPPGTYRLIAALYDAETGSRLMVGGPENSTGAIALGDVEIERAQTTALLAILPIQRRLDTFIGPVMLVGHDAYRKDFAHEPTMPIRPGDTVHFTLYWYSSDPLPPDWEDELTFALELGGQRLVAPLAGGAYPTSKWWPDELVRSEFDILYDGSGSVPMIEVAGQKVKLEALRAE